MQLRQGIPHHIDDTVLRANRIVNNALGQFQRKIQQGKQTRCHRQQYKLIAFGVLPNESKKRAFYSFSPRLQRRFTRFNLAIDQRQGCDTRVEDSVIKLFAQTALFAKPHKIRKVQ